MKYILTVTHRAFGVQVCRAECDTREGLAIAFDRYKPQFPRPPVRRDLLRDKELHASGRRGRHRRRRTAPLVELGKGIRSGKGEPMRRREFVKSFMRLVRAGRARNFPDMTPAEHAASSWDDMTSARRHWKKHRAALAAYTVAEWEQTQTAAPLPATSPRPYLVSGRQKSESL